MQIERMKVQGLFNPLGIETKQPVFSYLLTGCKEESANRQSAFRLLCASSKELLEQDLCDLWDSGVCRQKETFGIQYAGKKLQSGQIVYWKVMVWDQEEKSIGWSEISTWEMGLLSSKDWKGCWIGQGDDYQGKKERAPLFAKVFQIERKEEIVKARLYISGLGLFRASVNGQFLVDTLFDPGESDATKTVYYVTYDVLDKLQDGENALGVELGNGQYTGFQENPVMALPDGTLLPQHRYQKHDGRFVKPGISGDKKLITQLEILYQDGTVEVSVVSDESWKWVEGPTVFQNWYGGEDYDATLEIEGWNMPGMDRSKWNQARNMKAPEGRMKAREFPPIRIVEKIEPKEIKKISNGRWLVDMGRNGAGFPEISLNTTEDMRGNWIKMYPAELLSKDGDGVSQASCTQSFNERYECVIQDAYRIRGTGREEWHPYFCYQGFQYVEIEGWQGELKKENITYCIVRTDNEKTGSFYTSNPILNQISEMVEHSMESNMFGAFTDCPQIEKLGWIETSHLMFRSLADVYDIQAWMNKIINDIGDSQVDEEQALLEGNETAGYVPAIIPEYQRIVGLHRDPNWSGACVFTPWEYYWFYGDVTVLQRLYPVMQKYVKYLSGYLKDGVLDDYAQMGEWGELSEKTPKVLVATCSYYRMLDILSQTATLLGKEEDALDYRKQAENTKEAFYQNPQCYDLENDVYGSGSQASYGIVLFSGIVPEEKKKRTVERLANLIEDNGYHLSSGEVGLKQVFVALAEHGRSDVVYKMVMNETSPSYRFFADAGFTTLPEYWNCDELWFGMERSRNHAMMGHVKEWMSRYMLGIRPLEAGYKKVLINPWMPDDMNELKGSVMCPFGKISVECRREEQGIKTKVELPPGVEVRSRIRWCERSGKFI